MCHDWLVTSLSMKLVQDLQSRSVTSEAVSYVPPALRLPDGRAACALHIAQQATSWMPPAACRWIMAMTGKFCQTRMADSASIFCKAVDLPSKAPVGAF